MNESIFIGRLYNEPSPDWKGAEGVKKLQFFVDGFGFWTILFCEGKMGVQLFYGAAVDGGTLKSPVFGWLWKITNALMKFNQK